MIPVGYMAKRVCKAPDWLKAPQVRDIYSVSNCCNEDFANYYNYWKHNDYWFFDSPEIIRAVATENKIEMVGTALFYYEAHEREFIGENWRELSPEHSFPLKVVAPLESSLEGFDVVTFSAGSAPECSSLSCNSLAESIKTNSHCLFESFDEAKSCLNAGRFAECEPGPYRIIAVYSAAWPSV